MPLARERAPTEQHALPSPKRAGRSAPPRGDARVAIGGDFGGRSVTANLPLIGARLRAMALWSGTLLARQRAPTDGVLPSRRSASGARPHPRRRSGCYRRWFRWQKASRQTCSCRSALARDGASPGMPLARERAPTGRRAAGEARRAFGAVTWLRSQCHRHVDSAHVRPGEARRAFGPVTRHAA